jgi:ATP-binding cassette subfamily C (CFTR/MRP) protein 4
MGLHSLRKNISIIPQMPFLFKGTIKENVDPFNEYSDERIWKVLEESDLKDYVNNVSI